MTVFSSNIPDGMVQLMKDLTKDILKEHPENIYEYAAQYFENLLKKRDGSLDKGYGKFRSYEKYCKFIEQLQMKQLKQQQEKQKLKNRQSGTSEKSSNSGSTSSSNNNNYETDSGVGSSNTDDENIKVGGGNSSEVLKKLEVNGRAVPVGKRNNETITTTTNNKSIIQRRRKVNQKSLGVAADGGGGGDDTLAVATQAAGAATTAVATTTDTIIPPTTAADNSYDVVGDVTESSVVGDDENNIESELFTEIENDYDSGELVDNGRPYKSARPRKLSSKKPSENLIVIKEETSADVVAAGVTTPSVAADDHDHTNYLDDDHNKITKAATVIQTAFRKFIANKNSTGNITIATTNKMKMDENMAALVIQKCLKGFIVRKAYEKNKTMGSESIIIDETQKQRETIDIPINNVAHEDSTSKNDTELNTSKLNEEKPFDNIEKKAIEDNLSKNGLVNESKTFEHISKLDLSAPVANEVTDTKIEGKSVEIMPSINNSEKAKIIEVAANNIVNENPMEEDQTVSSSIATNEVININNNGKSEEKLIETSENNGTNQSQQSVSLISNNEITKNKNDEISEEKRLVISENFTANENHNQIKQSAIDIKSNPVITEAKSDANKNESENVKNDEKPKVKSSEIFENIFYTEKHNENQKSLIASIKNEIENANIDEKLDDKIPEISETKSTNDNPDEFKGFAASISNNDGSDIKTNEESEEKLSEILTDIVNSEKHIEDQQSEDVHAINDGETEDKSSKIVANIIDSEKHSEDHQSTVSISNVEVGDAKNNQKSVGQIITIAEISKNNSTSENFGELAAISNTEITKTKNDVKSDEIIIEQSGNNFSSENPSEKEQSISDIANENSDRKSSELQSIIVSSEQNSEIPISFITTSNVEVIDTKNDKKSDEQITDTSEINSSSENLDKNQQPIAEISKSEISDIQIVEKSDEKTSDINVTHINIEDTLKNTKHEEKSDEKIIKTSENNVISENVHEDDKNEEKLPISDLLDIKNIEKSEIKILEPLINDDDNKNESLDYKSASETFEINDQLSPLNNSTNKSADLEKSEAPGNNTDTLRTIEDTTSKQHIVIEEKPTNMLGNELNKGSTENQQINEDIAMTVDTKNHTKLEESISNNNINDGINNITLESDTKPPLEEKAPGLPGACDQVDSQITEDLELTEALNKINMSHVKSVINTDENISKTSNTELELTNKIQDQESSDNNQSDHKNENIDSGKINEATNKNLTKEQNDKTENQQYEKNDLVLNKNIVFDDKINKLDNESKATLLRDQENSDNILETTNEIKHDYLEDIFIDQNKQNTDLSVTTNISNDQEVFKHIQNVNSDNKSTDETQNNEEKEEKIKLNEIIKNIENLENDNVDIKDKITSDIDEATNSQHLKEISEFDAQLEKLNTPQSIELSDDQSLNKVTLVGIDDNKSDISSISKEMVKATNSENTNSDIHSVTTDNQLEKLNDDQTKLHEVNQSKSDLTENKSVDEFDLTKKIRDGETLVDQNQGNANDTKTKINYLGSVNDKETGEIEENKIDITDPIAKQLLSYSITDSKDNTDESATNIVQNKETDIEVIRPSNAEHSEKHIPLDMLSSFEEVGLKLVPTEIIEHAKLNDNPPILNDITTAPVSIGKEAHDQLLPDQRDVQGKIADNTEEENKSHVNSSQDQFNKTYTIDVLDTKKIDEKNDHLDQTFTIHGDNSCPVVDATISADNGKKSDELNRTFIIDQNPEDTISNNILDDQENSNINGLKRIKRSLDNLNERSGETAFDIDVNKDLITENENNKKQATITGPIINKDNSEPNITDTSLNTVEDSQIDIDGAHISSSGNIHELKPTSSEDSCDSDNGITFEVKRTKANDKFKESGIDETSRDELSEIENFDLSSCGEDSLEAMYYSLKKNELLLNKMQEQKDAKTTSIITDENINDDNDTRKNFPQNITKTLGNAMNQVMGSSNDNDDVVMGDGRLMSAESLTSATADEPSSADEMFKEMDLYELNNSGNVSYNKTSEKPKKAPKKSKTVSYFDANDYEDNDDDDDDDDRNGQMMTPMMASAMEQTSAFLHRIHGSIEEEREDDDEDDEQRKLKTNFSSYGSDERFDHFPDDDDYDDRPSSHHHRNILAASISEADSDFFNPSAVGSATAASSIRDSVSDNDDELGRLAPLTKRLIKDDFNISTAFGHLTSTDSDSTIISAATKIQAGARGFLTRRRLRRSSNDTSTTTANDTFCSFGNAAIDKSLEDLIEQQEQIGLDEAAVKIQKSFRKYLLRKNGVDDQQGIPLKSDSDERSGAVNDQQQSSSSSLSSSGEGNTTSRPEHGGIIDVTLGKKKLQENMKDLRGNSHSIKTTDEDSDSIENDRRQISVINTADNNFGGDTAQRRMTLQRGDAVQRNSTPDELSENNSSGDSVGSNSFKPSAPPSDDITEPIVISTETVAGTITTGAAATAAAPAVETPTDVNIDDDSNTNETDEKKMNKVFSNTKSVGQHKTDQGVIKPMPVKLLTQKSNVQLTGKNNFGGLIRQKSMPVQIDMEFMRIVPKHLRKRIKSADSQKKKK